MRTPALILLSLLGVWWALLSIFLVLNCRRRLRAAKEQPLTPEIREECRRLEDTFPVHRMRKFDWVLVSPIVLVMLPFYLYGWFVKDPYAEQDQS